MHSEHRRSQRSTFIIGRRMAAIDQILESLPRRTTVDIGGVAAGAANAATVAAAWMVPISSDYRVLLQPVVAPARIGTIFASIVPGSKTATGVSVTVVNLGPSTLVAGSLDVIAFPD
jgi:hypothetical protein